MSKDSLQGHPSATWGAPLPTMLSCLLVACSVTLLSLLPPVAAIGEEGWPEFGPVSAEQTLWSLARDQRPDPAITIHQYMLALVDANPGAFVADNVNLMRQGVVLVLPDAAFAQRISPGEASRRVDEQMQWYASLSQEEMRALRLEGRMPAPREESPEPQVEEALRLAEIAAAETVEADPAPTEAWEPDLSEAEALEPEWALAGDAELDYGDQSLVDHDLLAEDAPAAAVDFEETEERLFDAFPLEPLADVEADSVSAAVWADDQTAVDLAESEVMPAGQMPELSTAEDALEGETVVPAEEAVAEPATPALIQPAAPAEPARSLTPLLMSLGLILVLLLLALIWFVRRRRTVADDSAPMPADQSKLASAAMSAAPVAGSTVQQQPEAKLGESSGPATTEDDWGSLEAAVIAAGPVPKIDAELAGEEAEIDLQAGPDSPPSADANEPGSESGPEQRLAELDVPAGESITELTVEETDPLAAEASGDVAGSSDSDDFVLEDLGWFEEDDGASPEGESENDQQDLDLAALSQRQEADDEAPVSSAEDDDLEAELDLSELAGKLETAEDAIQPAHEPGSSAESEVDSDVELDLDLELDLSDGSDLNPLAFEGDLTSEADPASAPHTGLQPVPEAESEVEHQAEAEPEQETEQETEQESEPEAKPEPEPEPEPELEPAPEAETTPESEPESLADSAAELDDASAEVMLDLARLSAEGGDEDYAREVLEELIAKSSAEMAARARELRDSLGG